MGRQAHHDPRRRRGQQISQGVAAGIDHAVGPSDQAHGVQGVPLGQHGYDGIPPSLRPCIRLACLAVESPPGEAVDGAGEDDGTEPPAPVHKRHQGVVSRASRPRTGGTATSQIIGSPRDHSSPARFFQPAEN